MRTISVKDSSIKGYHEIRRRPHFSIEKLVTLEKENEFDLNAMDVKMPTLEDISHKYHEKSNKRGEERITGTKSKGYSRRTNWWSATKV